LWGGVAGAEGKTKQQGEEVAEHVEWVVGLKIKYYSTPIEAVSGEGWKLCIPCMRQTKTRDSLDPTDLGYYPGRSRLRR
jgi:hypothetical protein